MDVAAGADRGPRVPHPATHGPPQADPVGQGLRAAGGRRSVAPAHIDDGGGGSLVALHRQRLPRPAARQLALVGEGDGCPPRFPVPMFEN